MRVREAIFLNFSESAKHSGRKVVARSFSLGIYRESVSKTRRGKLPACPRLCEGGFSRRSGADAGSVGHASLVLKLPLGSFEEAQSCCKMPIAPQVSPKTILGLMTFDGAADVEEWLRKTGVELASPNVRIGRANVSHRASERIASGRANVSHLASRGCKPPVVVPRAVAFDFISAPRRTGGSHPRLA